jgi:Family of unknown function (DUF6152)
MQNRTQSSALKITRRRSSASAKNLFGGDMKHNFATRYLWLFALLLVAVPALAHHGNAAFDPTKRVTMKGTVTQWFWANPHCFLQFDAKDESGNLVHWVAETSNPPDMINHGWSKSSLKVGDQVTVTVIPVKNGKPIGRIAAVVLPNGQTLDGGFGPLPQTGGSAGSAGGGSK